MELFINPPKLEEAEERMELDSSRNRGKRFAPAPSVCHPLARHVIDLAQNEFVKADEFNPVANRGLWGGPYVAHDINGIAINTTELDAHGTYAQYLFRRVVQFHSWQPVLFGFGMPNWDGVVRLNGEFMMDGFYSGCIASGIPQLPVLCCTALANPTTYGSNTALVNLTTDRSEIPSICEKTLTASVEDVVYEMPFNHMWVRYLMPSKERAIISHGMPPTPPADSPRLAFDPYHAVYFLRQLLAQPVLEPPYLRNSEYIEQVLNALSQIIRFSKLVIETCKDTGCSEKWLQWFREWVLNYSAHALNHADVEELAMELEKDPDGEVQRTKLPADVLAEMIVVREWMVGVYYIATAFDQVIRDRLERVVQDGLANEN